MVPVESYGALAEGLPGMSDDDVRDQILAGIRRYLCAEFTGSAVHEVRGAHTGTVIFHIEDVTGHHRLEVTEMYLQSDDGPDQPIEQLISWNVADVIRKATAQMVRLTTSGVKVDVQRVRPQRPRSRGSAAVLRSRGQDQNPQ
jgi:hypothetical protein